MNRFHLALGKKPERLPGLKGIDCVDVNKFIDDPQKVDEYTAAMAMVYPHDKTITLGPTFDWFNEHRAIDRVDKLKEATVRLDDFMVVVRRVLLDRLTRGWSLTGSAWIRNGPIEDSILFTESVEEWRVLATALFCDDNKCDDTFKNLAYSWQPQTVNGAIQSRRDEVFSLAAKVLDIKEKRRREADVAAVRQEDATFFDRRPSLTNPVLNSIANGMVRDMQERMREALAHHVGELNTVDEMRRINETIVRALGLPAGILDEGIPPGNISTMYGTDLRNAYMREVTGIAAFNPRAIARVQLRDEKTEENPNGTV